MRPTKTRSWDCQFPFHLVRVACVAVLIVAWCSGCRHAGPDPLSVYPVKGEVFVNGKPAEGAVIAFHPQERTDWKSTTSRGVVTKEGSFSLTTYAKDDGAPEGEYVVTVYWPARLLDPSGEGGDLPADKLENRFINSGKSKLRAQVGREAVTLARVDLKAKAVWEGQEFYFEKQGP